ncbi:MAG: sulfite exporter TauE/SafE family protein [Eggerthellaceae bacterium]|nr:sulfite exporter TauE/SafE family protein [Eggerthellaceae bacterium]
MIGTFAVMALIGVAIGFFSGMLGIGGGMVMVPLFRLVLGLSAVGSTATSLFTIIPTSISGAVSHMRAKTCVPKLGIMLGIGGACTSWLGVWLAQLSPAWLVMFAAAAVIAYSGITMFHKALKAPRQSVATGKGQTPIPEPPVLTTKQFAKAVGIGALAGIASGYVGLGGGFIMVPLMLALLNMPMKLASGTSLIAVMILATPATVMQCALGNVHYLAGIAMACGSIPGAIVGAKLVKYVPERMLRFVFAVFITIAAILLVLKEVGVLG